jgi:hypothetical protein
MNFIFDKDEVIGSNPVGPVDRAVAQLAEHEIKLSCRFSPHLNIMKKNQKIEITKLSPTVNPAAFTPPKEGYRYGQVNDNVSLPVDYTAIGVLEEDIEVGKSIKMLRESRNGVVTPGLFQTSPIVKITGNQVSTLNSIYLIKEL